MAIQPEIEARVARALDALPDGSICVAFSGGLDSSVLLDLLAGEPRARERGLSAVHVDHGLHTDSARWAAHCTRVANELDVPIAVVTVVVDRNSGLGIEAAAREARHVVFEQQMADGGSVALAQHRDDQAETVLLKLLRGAGPEGLGAMRTLRPFGNGWLWRPLLDVPREELHAYAIRRGLGWVEDPSNALCRHDRNFLRLEILPRLRERWPETDANLAHSAAWARDAAMLVAQQADEALRRVRGSDPATLHIPEWLALPDAVRDAVLRQWLRELGLQKPTRSQAGELQRQLRDARVDSVPYVHWQQTELRRYRDLLHAMPSRPSPPVDWQQSFDGSALQLPCDLGELALIDSSGCVVQTTEALTVRFRRGGERIGLPGRDHRSELRDLFQQAGVPPWQRDRLPIVLDSASEVMAVGDRWISANAQSLFDRLECRLRWQTAIH